MSDILVITGPTATGKTGLGIRLANKLGGEVVSADSMQIYRRMDIGTAKPTKEEMGDIPHHMIDVADPWENYSVARYVKEASDCVDDIISRGRLPIVVGGTGLYIESLISGREFAEKNSDNNLREEISLEFETLGGQAMLKRLGEVDPESGEKLHPNDKKRIVRALEVYKLTGMTISQHNAYTKSIPPRYETRKIALTFNDREDLYRRINERVDVMVSNGLIKEVEVLMAEGLSEKNTSMQAIGYKEVAEFLCGQISKNEAIEKIKMESRRYAKRQLSWIRRDETVKWIKWDKFTDFEYGERISTDFLK